MWENPIFKKVWEVGKKSAVLMKKHYKNGLMLGVLLLAMFFEQHLCEFVYNKLPYKKF